MNDSIQMHRDRCTGESFNARADRGGVNGHGTQRLGILESRRGHSFLSLDYRENLSAWRNGRRKQITKRCRLTHASRSCAGAWTWNTAIAGSNPAALTPRSVKPENDRVGKASRSADRLVDVNPSPSAVRGITDTALFLSARAKGQASRPMMASDLRGELVSPTGHADCGGNPHALTISEESGQFRPRPHNPRKDAPGMAVETWLGGWCNRARRKNLPAAKRRVCRGAGTPDQPQWRWTTRTGAQRAINPL